LPPWLTTPRSRTRSMFRQMLEAIVYLHDNNVVHRDLKVHRVLGLLEK